MHITGREIKQQQLKSAEPWRSGSLPHPAAQLGWPPLVQWQTRRLVKLARGSTGQPCGAQHPPRPCTSRTARCARRHPAAQNSSPRSGWSAAWARRRRLRDGNKGRENGGWPAPHQGSLGRAGRGAAARLGTRCMKRHPSPSQAQARSTECRWQVCTGTGPTRALHPPGGVGADGAVLFGTGCGDAAAGRNKEACVG